MSLVNTGSETKLHWPGTFWGRLQGQAGYRCQADQQVNSVLYLIDGPLALAIAETTTPSSCPGRESRGLR